MQLTHIFVIPVDVALTWNALTDIALVAECMPGASIERVDGDESTGMVKVRVGPMAITYRGKARFVEKNETDKRATIEASGRDAQGAGNASATVVARLAEVEAGTQVRVDTTLRITGRPAQFGSGIMNDVGERLLGEFAHHLAERLTDQYGTEANTADTRSITTASEANSRGGPVDGGVREPAEVINLIQVAGAPLLKRVGVAAIGIASVVVLLVLLWRLLSG